MREFSIKVTYLKDVSLWVLPPNTIMSPCEATAVWRYLKDPEEAWRIHFHPIGSRE